MSLYQRYRNTYIPREIQTISSRFSGALSISNQDKLGIMSKKFFNFFMKFRYERIDRYDDFYYKSQRIVTGSKSLELEEYKLEQLQWITNLDTQERIRRIFGKYFFILECRRRIQYFLVELHRYKLQNVDLYDISNEGYRINLRSRLRPRAHGFDHTFSSL